jgi:pimeloyl-ACP methyl ester carboxylesterase
MIAAGIEYATEGAGDPPVICLHGIGGDTESFRPQLDGLSRDRRIIAWNMPGYGGSAPLQDVTFPALAEALIGFMDALGVETAHLCGQSIGGMVAMEAACAHPARVASLALIATTSAFGGRDDSFKDAFIAARLKPLDQGLTLPDLAERFVPEITGPIADEAARRAATRSMSLVPEATYRDIIRCLVTFNRRDDIAGLAMPACLIAGSHDQMAPERTMRKMAEAMPRAAFHLIECAGHLVNLEAGDETNAILSDFYGRVE